MCLVYSLIYVLMGTSNKYNKGSMQERVRFSEYGWAIRVGLLYEYAE